ncbi:hypothetical protein OESDEN_19421 [Oesophagostomum dentatum]|uniref:Uncharacterized protein n=1 Tax=Oesophagostomum dentatum TaxID=61180 RepID=A0A0B1S7H5_OESDE|nr:hypothetical protein OESDEN_19421 [Oesophagostomum dentatum]
MRCGQEHDQAVPVNDQPVGWRCKRCQLAQSLRLRPELVHENSPITALLEARGCRPLDCILQQSQLRFVCLDCGKEDDVQVKTVSAIVEGQPLPELGTCKHYRKSYRWFR